MAVKVTRAALMAACEGSILPGNVGEESELLTVHDLGQTRACSERLPGALCYHGASLNRAIAMAFRPLPARAPSVLLREAKPLKALFSAAQRLDRLQHLLESQLQPAAREHCHLASWREGCLLLIVTDGHWATRLRYQQRRLQRQLQLIEEFAGLQRILFKVQPAYHPQQPANQSMVLSSAAAESIQTTADGISDPKLRAALERLASHVKKPDSAS